MAASTSVPAVLRFDLMRFHRNPQRGEKLSTSLAPRRVRSRFLQRLQRFSFLAHRSPGLAPKAPKRAPQKVNISAEDTEPQLFVKVRESRTFLRVSLSAPRQTDET